MTDVPKITLDLPPKPVRSGGLAAQDKDGKWMVAYPNDQMYSSMSMVATMYSNERLEWTMIDE